MSHLDERLCPTWVWEKRTPITLSIIPFSFSIAETYGSEEESILQTALLWKSNVSVYIGPQETW